jgi:hypothetical protein
VLLAVETFSGYYTGAKLFISSSPSDDYQKYSKNIETIYKKLRPLLVRIYSPGHLSQEPPSLVTPDWRHPFVHACQVTINSCLAES